MSCVAGDIIYPCANMSAPCNNHGLCLDRNVTSYRCLCEAGYTGSDCEIDIDDCAGSPCFNGDCVDKVNGYLCECPAGFEGIRCQTSECAVLSNSMEKIAPSKFHSTSFS